MTTETPADDEYGRRAEGLHCISHRYQGFADGKRFIDPGTVAGEIHRYDRMSVSLEHVSECLPLGTRSAETVHEYNGGEHHTMLMAPAVVIA